MLIIEFSYNFPYVWNCMKLYDKKFLIYGNCMIRSFGQPGNVATIIGNSGYLLEKVFFPLIFSHAEPSALNKNKIQTVSNGV